MPEAMAAIEDGTIEEAARLRAAETVVREWPQYFAILVPVERLLSEIEIER